MQSNPCVICLGAIGAGGGQAIFTADCCHTFHFSCITTIVSKGRRVCPLCNAQWRELPSVRPVLPSSMPPTLPQQPLPRMEPMHGVQPPPPWQQPVPAAQPQPRRPPEPEVFDMTTRRIRPPLATTASGAKQWLNPADPWSSRRTSNYRLSPGTHLTTTSPSSFTSRLRGSSTARRRPATPHARLSTSSRCST